MNLKQLIQQQEEAFEKYLLEKYGVEVYRNAQNDLRPMIADNLPRITQNYYRIGDSNGLVRDRVVLDFLHSSTQAILRGVVEEIEKIPDTYPPAESDMLDKGLLSMKNSVIAILEDGIKE